jgi:hypothetical protein
VASEADSNKRQFPFLLCAGLNVKTAPFADQSDNSFEKETQSYQELLSKSGTVDNPYLYLPPNMMKLCLLHHPPSELEQYYMSISSRTWPFQKYAELSVKMFLISAKPAAQASKVQDEQKDKPKVAEKKSGTRKSPSKPKKQTSTPTAPDTTVIEAQVPFISGTDKIRIYFKAAWTFLRIHFAYCNPNTLNNAQKCQKAAQFLTPKCLCRSGNLTTNHC